MSILGFGHSGGGSHHWWVQRLSALALIPLALWFVFAVVHRVDLERQVLIEWIQHPLTTVLLVLYFACMFYHAQLGLQVVIEDYIHTESRRNLILLVVKTGMAIAAIASIFAVIRIAW